MLEEKRHVERVYLEALVRVESEARAAALSLGLERLAERIAMDITEARERLARLEVEESSQEE